MGSKSKSADDDFALITLFVTISYLGVFVLLAAREVVNMPNPVVMNIDEIAVTLRESGYRIMAPTLKKELLLLLPGKISTDDKSNTTILHKGGITIFVPKDTAFAGADKNDPYVEYGPVIAFSSHEEGHTPRISIGSTLYTSRGTVTVDSCARANKYERGDNSLCIYKARISDWYVYNEGRVSVHGVDDLFRPPDDYDIFIDNWDDDDCYDDV